jgi:2'-deoxynucleoside 5'-phosphate N-hydrolase
MAAIYFSGAITGGRGDVPLYRRIVETLESEGHRVFAGVVAATEVSDSGEPLDSVSIFERDLAWIGEVAVANGLVVAEVSQPSTGVGYEIATARYQHDIPVVCLYRPKYTKRCTAMIAGDEGIETIEYSDDTIEWMLSRLVHTVRAIDESRAALARQLVPGRE